MIDREPKKNHGTLRGGRCAAFSVSLSLSGSRGLLTETELAECGFTAALVVWAGGRGAAARAALLNVVSPISKGVTVYAAPMVDWARAASLPAVDRLQVWSNKIFFGSGDKRA